jgi:hypothetical protein
MLHIILKVQHENQSSYVRKVQLDFFLLRISFYLSIVRSEIRVHARVYVIFIELSTLSMLRCEVIVHYFEFCCVRARLVTGGQDSIYMLR